MDKIRKYDLEIVVFVCGAVVMIFELIGSRIVAPYVGTSIYVWTSLIGVILASLSAGYYFGGRFADAKPDAKPLAIIIFISALAIIFSTFVKDAVSVIVILFPLPIEIKSLLISIILFAPASFLLGTVSPYAVRLRIKDVEKAGSTSGNLYAVSTFGSIGGTFLAGFYLIPHFGSVFSLFLLSVVLVLVAIFLVGNEILQFLNKISTSILLPLIIFFVVYLVMMPMFKNSNLVADVDTEYNRIFITKEIDPFTKRPTMYLSTDPFDTQAAVFIDDLNDLVFDYTKFFKMIEVIKPDVKTALMLGGCVYTYPRDFLKNFPTANIDVVELDPGMTELAKKYFGLEDNERMNIIHEDGRIYLNRNQKKYDAIFIDVFNSFASLPFQLTTAESVRKNYAALHDDGVIFVNLISAIEGDGGKFFRAEYATFKSIFPHVYVFALDASLDSSVNQNVILVATKSEKGIDFSAANTNPLLRKYSEKLWIHPIADNVPILKDDFAPVEFYKRISI